MGNQLYRVCNVRNPESVQVKYHINANQCKTVETEDYKNPINVLFHYI